MDEIIDIPIIIENEELQPSYMTQDAAGADIRAHLNEPVTLLPGKSVLIPTGMKMAIPTNYEIQVRPRSGLALKHGVTVLNTPGTIDADYRGEIGIILINHGHEPFIIVPGMRIAQIVLARVARANFIPTHELETTSRAGNGFGHTGKH